MYIYISIYIIEEHLVWTFVFQQTLQPIVISGSIEVLRATSQFIDNYMYIYMLSIYIYIYT